MKLENFEDIVKYYHDRIISDEPLAFVDTNYTLFEINPPALEMINRERDQVINKSIIEISHERWRDNLRTILHECINQRKEHQVLSLRFSRQMPYWLLLFTYTPILSTLDNQVLGVRVTATVPHFKLNPYNLHRIFSNTFDGHVRQMVEKDKQKPLSEIELSILFLLSHSFSYEEIASTLTMVYPYKPTNKGIVAKIVSRKLYTKFNVSNLISLKSKYQKSRLNAQIPKMLFGEFSYLIY